jgi:cytidylate kinase
MVLVCIGDIMRDGARECGYPGLTQMILDKGAEGAFGFFREAIFDGIKKTAHTNDVVVDGLYDIKLAGRMRASFGNRMVVIEVQAPEALRSSRIASRNGTDALEGKLEAERRDAVKMAAGLGEVIAMAQIQIPNCAGMRELHEMAESTVLRVMNGGK